MAETEQLLVEKYELEHCEVPKLIALSDIFYLTGFECSKQNL